MLITRKEAHEEQLLLDLGKAAIQVVAVAVLGAVLKLLADGYQAERERLAQDRKFRQDKYDRLVGATNALRRVPILINADKSVTTWDEQMRAVIEAGLELRMIKHQIWSSKGVPNPPFRDHRELTYLFESLYHYTDWVIADFADAKRRLSVQQRCAEEDKLSPNERENRQEAVWVAILELDSVRDMRRPASRDDHKRSRADVEKELEAAVRVKGETASPQGPWSWLRYEETEGLALERITQTTLEHGRDRWTGLRLRSRNAARYTRSSSATRETAPPPDTGGTSRGR